MTIQLLLAEAATVGGIAGYWLRAPNTRPGARILYLHGGGYVLGGMPHVFQSSTRQFLAAKHSVNAIGDFLRQRLETPAEGVIPSNSIKGA